MIQRRTHPALTCTTQVSWHTAASAPSARDPHLRAAQAACPAKEGLVSACSDW